jgi:hypothetical protein
MAEKVDKDVEKANELLKKHPDLTGGAAHLFTFDKNPVIQETVPHGDATQPGLNPNEITGKDLLDIAGYAIGILEPRIMAVNPAQAYEDAAQRAIVERNDGMYAGRLGSKMVDLVLQAMEQQKPKLEKAPDMNTKVMDFAKNGLKAEGVGELVAAPQSLYIEPILHEAAVSSKGAVEIKTAAKKKGLLGLSDLAQHARKDNSLQKITQEARSLSNANSGRVSEVIKAVQKGMKGKGGKKEASADLVAQLDRIASQLESTGLSALAARVDTVSNSLDKE